MIKDTTVTYNDAVTRAGQRLYNFKTEAGEVALPLTAGTDTFSFMDMTAGNERAYFEIAFWDDALQTNRVLPLAGTVKFRGAMTPNKIWKTMSGGSFNALDYDNEGTVIPNASGPMRFAEVVLDGDMSPATHATVTVDKYSL